MTDALNQAELLGIDWGLTRLRAYCIGQEGRILQQRESDLGILAVADRAFAPVLRGLIGDWLTAAPHLPTYLCGMIGSRNGWYEASYSACPATVRQVAESALLVDIGDRDARLIGGLSYTDERGTPDVIRGEETQIFGVSAQAGFRLVVTPGTHSKWAAVQDGAVTRFRTYMTGELFAVLSRHSSLGWWTQEAPQSVEDHASFLEGVHASLQDADLSHALFTVRSRALFKDRPAAAHAAYLSGILIGNEVTHGVSRDRQAAVTVIGSASLTHLYRAALSTVGVDDVTCIVGDEAVARGLWRLRQCRTSP